MVNSTIKIPADGSLLLIEFGADDNYSLKWGLDRMKKRGKKGGEGALGSGGYSSMSLTVNGGLVSGLDAANTGADFQLWDKVLALKDYMKKDTVCYVNLVLDTGNLAIVGWVTDFVADRQAPSGIVKIPITMELFIQSEDHSGLS